MPHFYERNIIEIKDSYQTFLVNILTPLVYEGILSIFKNAKEYHTSILERSKVEPNVKVPGVLKIFQIFLKNTPSWNNNTIVTETNRIKEKSKCSEYFDDLVKGVVKSYIVLLSFNTSVDESELIHNKHHEKVDSNNFIHKCYIECARSIYNFPELFWDKFPPIEIKRNQRETFQIIKDSIKEAIRKLLPMKLILSEFLKKEYTKEIVNVEEKIPLSAYKNIQAMLSKDLNNNTRMSAYNTTEESSTDSTSTNSSDASNELESIRSKLDNILSINHQKDDKIIKDIFLKNEPQNNMIEEIRHDDFKQTNLTGLLENNLVTKDKDINIKNDNPPKVIQLNNKAPNNDIFMPNKTTIP